MANLPVESMKTGGIAWFTDLTVSDPYFALPVLTMALLSATIEVSIASTCITSLKLCCVWGYRGGSPSAVQA